MDKNDLMAAVCSGMNDHDRRLHGWSAAVNLVTPIHYRHVPRRAATLWTLKRGWAVRAMRRAGLLQIRPVENQLRRLNHLHVARWSLVPRLPWVEGAKCETGVHSLLLFTSHFDAGWRRYLGTFIETTGNGLAHLWGDTPSWRFPTDGSRDFENFVVDQQVPHGHLFAAFPRISSGEIVTALRLRQEMLAQSDGHEILLGLDPSTSHCRAQARARARLRRMQYCVGSTHPLQYPDPPPAAPVTSDPHDYSVTALLPFDHDAEGDLRTELGKLGFGSTSPFARIPGTHFARLALIGRKHFERRSVPPLKNGYLLLSAEFDGSRADWLGHVADQQLLQGVWRLCHGTERNTLPRLIMRCRIKPSLEYINYPNATVSQIADAIQGHPGRVGEVRDSVS